MCIKIIQSSGDIESFKKVLRIKTAVVGGGRHVARISAV